MPISNSTTAEAPTGSFCLALRTGELVEQHLPLWLWHIAQTEQEPFASRIFCCSAAALPGSNTGRDAYAFNIKRLAPFGILGDSPCVCSGQCSTSAFTVSSPPCIQTIANITPPSERFKVPSDSSLTVEADHYLGSCFCMIIATRPLCQSPFLWFW